MRKAQLARAEAALDRAQKYMKRLKASDNEINTSTGTITIRWSFTNDSNILLPGVKPGDVVAEYGVQFLTDGAKVNIQDK